MSKSPQDAAVEADILQDVTSLTADEAFELADVIEYAMDMPANHGKTWTASLLAREVRLGGLRPATHQVGQVLQYLVRHEYVKCDDRGAWTRYWR